MLLKVVSILFGFTLGVIGYESDLKYEPLKASPNFEMDFKVTLKIFNEECYFHYYHLDDTLHMIVNILSGGDTKVDVKIYDPNRLLVHNQTDVSFVWHDISEIKTEGVYCVCIENKSVYEKVAFINVISLSKDHLQAKELEKTEFDNSHEAILGVLLNTTFNINQMRRYQILQKFIHIGDFYYVEANNEYVMYYSIVQSILIVIAAMLQVYFIKKLFSVGDKRKFAL